MAARVVLALCAAALVAWLGVLLRNEVVAQSAGDRVFYGDRVAEREVDRQLERLEGARLLDPDLRNDRLRANLLLLLGRRVEAADAADALVRAEPASLEAWTLVERATSGRDPGRAARARAEIRRLDPLGSGAAARR